MTERQVEVVGGDHLVAIHRDAVVVVGHRDSAPLSPASPTYRAWLALRGLIATAHDQDGERFAVTLARLVDNWSSGMGSNVSFGIVAPIPNGYQFILRGDVSALIDDGAGIETLHGTRLPGAPLSVDRPPAVRVAVFVVDGGASPGLPAGRGIGSLVDGVAPGRGAVLWSGAPPAHAEPPAPPPAEPEPVDPADQATVLRPMPFPNPRVEVKLTPPRLHETIRPDDAPEPRRPPLPINRPQRRGERVAAPQAPTPAPGPPAGQRQRPSLPQVRGIICARGHFNNPDGAFCRQCGLRMNQTKLFTMGPRPPLGFLVLDDGSTITLIRDLVIGREPERSPALRDGAIPIRLENNGGVLSRAHAAIRLIEWDVTVVDLESRNGTAVKPAGQHVWMPLTPNAPFKLVPGTEVQFGGIQGRKATFDSPLVQY